MVIGLVGTFAIGSLWPLSGFVGFTLLPIVGLGVPLALRRLTSS
jgi:predicted cobalt transporter CbtA